MNYTLRTLILFLIVTFIGYAISMLSDHLFLTNDLVIRDLSKSYTNDEIANILERKENGTFVFFIIRLIYKFLLVITVSSIISIGLVLNELNVKWIKIVRIVIISSLVFLIPAGLKIL